MEKLNKKNIEDILPLTPMQEGMLFHYLKDPESDHYFEQLTLHISGEIDIGRFEKAWNVVIKTNEMLRTVFRWENVEYPLQIILKEHKLQPIYFDFTNGDYSRIKEQVEQVKAKDRSEKFDLRQVPFRVTLCKLEETGYDMIISNHHILYDGWSNGIILKEFFAAYDALCALESLIPPYKTKFREFVKWHQEQDHREKQTRFWEDYLNDFDTQTVLPGKAVKQDPGHPVMKDYRLVLEKDIRDKLEIFLKENRLTMAVFFYCTWGILLQKYCNSDDVVFGTVVSGRSAPLKDIMNMLGLFINTIPLRVKGEPGDKVMDLLLKVSNILPVREEYENTSLVDIKKCRRLETGEEFFDSIVVIENYPLDSRLLMENRQLKVESYAVVERTHYDLTLVIMLFDVIELIFTYNKNIFNKEMIVRLGNHFRSICEAIITGPGKEAAHLDILSKPEREQVLYDFNATAREYPQDKTIYELYARQAEQTPDHVALIGQIPNPKSQIPNKEAAFGEANLRAKSQELRAITYKELNEKSNRLAWLLKEKDVKSDTIVGIMMERSIEMVIGILGILKAGGAYLPIDPGSPGERIKYMLKDSGAKILVTVPGLSEKFEKLLIVNCQLLMGNEMFPRGLSENTGRTQNKAEPLAVPGGNGTGETSTSTSTCQVSPTNLAYVIYTSGSTGQPKGVMVQQFSVVNLLWALQHKYPFRESDVFLLKTSYFFDVSVCELFGWFLGGGRLAVLEQNGEKDPKKILDTIENAWVTHINFVPSMFKVFTDTLNPRNIKKLSTLRYIFLAGETLLPRLIHRFRRLNAVIALENIYGPTEAAVYASWYSLSLWSGDEMIPIGKPLPNIQLFILDRSLNLQPPGVPGELTTAGVGAARGYLNNPRLTSEKFIKYELQIQSNPGYYRSHKSYILYKTGDLARWQPDGNVEFLGRMDHQVKVRGFRIELGEIENQLLKHEKVKETVVIDVENKVGDKNLAAYLVSDSEASILVPQLREYLLEFLPGYMVPAYFITLEKMPLNPNGKVDRQSLPEPVVGDNDDYTAPRDGLERKLAEIWAEVLRLSVPIGIDSNFFQLGGHSLTAIPLLAKIHKDFKVKLSLSELFKRPTIRTLSQYIRNTGEGHYLSIQAVEEKEYYSLSSAQKRLYILHRMDEKSTGYNISSVFQLEGSICGNRLEEVFSSLVARHESLRTSFGTVDEEPVQQVKKEVEFEIEYDDMKEVEIEVKVKVEEEDQTTDDRGQKTEEKRQTTGDRPGTHLSSSDVIRHLSSEFIRPFDLSQAPLLRVGLIKTREQEHLLMVDMHHIISDGTSISIFVKEFNILYGDGELPGPKVHYKDYVEWQRRIAASEKGKEVTREQAAYWREQFKGGIPSLDLPIDYPSPAQPGFEGGSVDFEIGIEETRALNQIALKEEATLYMVLLAIINILLSKITNRQVIILGTALAGRGHEDLGPVTGVFVNTLALINYPSWDYTFVEFLKDVKKRTLAAFENQDYPFDELVKQVAGKRGTHLNPIFDVAFGLQNVDVPGLEMNPLTISNFDPGIKHARFDLAIVALEKEQTLHFSFEYCSELFKEVTIKRYTGYFKEIVTAVLPDGNIRLKDIKLSHRLLSMKPKNKQVEFGF